MQVNTNWDKDACVWIAECETLGLVLESGSYDALLERVKISIPELIELNHIAERTFVISTRQQDQISPNRERYNEAKWNRLSFLMRFVTPSC